MSVDIATRPSMLKLVKTLAPGPSPHSGRSMPPTVLRVPVTDYSEFRSRVVTRYESQLKTFWPRAMMNAAANSAPTVVSDARLVEHVVHGGMAAMVTTDLDETSAKLFDPILERSPDARWALLDLTAMDRVRRGGLLQGCHVAPTRALMKERDDGQDPVLRAIELDGVVFEPGDGAAWDLAKLFVAQGAYHGLIIAAHPKNHFPYDTVNGVTRSTLPADHVLRRLLAPHFYVHLALNFGVLYSERSVARNDQRNIYTPFCATEAGQFQLVRAGWKGVDGSNVWKPYRFPLGLRNLYGPLGDFGRHYQRVIEDHTARTLEGVDASDPRILHWADQIALHLPGFPDALRIVRPGVLAQAAASIISGVSLYHALEHYTASRLPAHEVPLRLRIEPPKTKSHPGFDTKTLTTRRDMFRQHLACEMFFKVFPLELLQDVDYTFEDATRRKAAATFRSELREASKHLPGREYVPLNMISSSLQY